MTWGCVIKNAVIRWENPHGDFSLKVDKELSLSADKVPIMGKNGSGKSLLLNLMAGLKWPQEGEVCWTFPDQREINWSCTKRPSPQKLVELRLKKFGFAFQNSTLLPHLNVVDNLSYPLKLKGVSTANARTKARDILLGICKNGNCMLLDEEKQEIDEILQRFPHEISGGQSQRIALAQAVVHEPNVLFADEPTGHLDGETRIQVRNVLKNWLTEPGWQGKRMLIWVTHHDDDPKLYSAKKCLRVKHIDPHNANCHY